MFEPLNFPTIDSRIEPSEAGLFQIFDICRKRMVQLTPEEWVRQHVLHYLNTVLSYPLSLMAVEKQLKLNATTKRTDIVVYNAALKPLMIVECKAPGVRVDQEVLNQALRYNMALKVPYLLLTNGLRHVCLHLNGDEPVVLKGIPLYSELNG